MIRHDTIASRIRRSMLGLVVVLTVSFSVLRLYDNHDDDPGAKLGHHIGNISEIVDATPRPQRAAFIGALHADTFSAELADTYAVGGTPQGGFTAWILCRLIAGPHHDPQRQVTVTTSPGTTAPVLIQVPLTDGQWLRFTVPDPDSLGGFPYRHFAERVALAAFLVWLLSLWTARRLAAPIAAFASAAERLGKGTDTPPLPERGPHELRVATRAFNDMQDRLQRFVRDRTQMLAAMSHDLRTPLTRMTLRAEFIEDPWEKRKMLGDLAEMIAMIESTLTFAREDFNRETRALVDLRALIESICQDAADTRAVISCSVAERIDLECRPQALRRAITNLVDNALKYGGSAHVEVLKETGKVLVLIEDQGPGIPPDQHERVFTPFYRLESSRNRETGGAGLGLALVRTIVHGHGGNVTLANRNEGGLRVRVELPA